MLIFKVCIVLSIFMQVSPLPFQLEFLSAHPCWFLFTNEEQKKLACHLMYISTTRRPCSWHNRLGQKWPCSWLCFWNFQLSISSGHIHVGFSFKEQNKLARDVKYISTTHVCLFLDLTDLVKSGNAHGCVLGTFNCQSFFEHTRP